MVPPDLILSLSQQFTEIPNFCSFFLTWTDISSVQYIYDNEKSQSGLLVSWLTSQTQVRRITAWANLLTYTAYEIHLPSIHFICMIDRCHFLKDKFQNYEQLAWYQAFTLLFCKNTGEQNLLCDSVCIVPVNGTFSFNCMQITEHIRVS